SASNQAEFGLWVRHKDKLANDLVALLCIADMAPPAILTVFKELAPVSTMTWMLNFLNDEPYSKDGWWQVHSNAQNAKDGYSSESIRIWNSDGELSVIGQQNVTIFY
ncbi:thioesterase family protein, partial [Arenicella sp.]|nr:thioesterase family protein [Arenicella sp.]